MNELFMSFKDNFGTFGILVSFPVGQGCYNLYRGHQLARHQRPNEQVLTERSKWFFHIGRIMLLIAMIFLAILCCIGFLLRVQLEEIIALVIVSVLVAPIYAIGLLFASRSKHISK